MLKKEFDKLIKEQAEEIKEKLIGAKIYGHDVDMKNLDSVIVAVYYMAKQTSK